MNPEKEEKKLLDDAEKISRRDFLKIAGSTLGAIAFGPQIELLEKIADQTDRSFEEASLSYIAKSHKEATFVSRCLRQDPSASPSNICGPLATAILLGWKLNNDGSFSNVSDNSTNGKRMEGITPREMWLGSPENDPNRYEIAFPRDKYDRYNIKESIGTLDFNNIPYINELNPGDFLYLDGGSFTHYIAISRRDKEGRIYCVSNIHSETSKDEFIIDEVMLWDPTKRDGFFRSWAKGVGAERARTGLKGFYLWRRKVETEAIAEDPIARKHRDVLLNEMLKQKNGEWSVYINEIGKGELFEWRDGIVYPSVSTIGLPIAILAIQNITKEYDNEIRESSFEEVLQKKGIDGKSFEQLISAMLVNSEESATESIVRYIKGKEDLKKAFVSLGMNKTSYESRRTTQKDLFECWKRLFSTKAIKDDDARGYLIRKLEEYTSDEDKLIGNLRERLPGARQWNKRSNITKDFGTVQDSGILQIPTEKGFRYLYIGIAGISTNSRSISYAEAKEYVLKIMGIVEEYIKEDERPDIFRSKNMK